MRTLSIIFWLGVLFLSLPAQSIQQIYFDRFTHYTIDDWITYAPATNITAVEIGDDYVYFGTRSGGILRYHLFDDYWDFPFTTSSGLRSNTILSLSYDPAQRRLWLLEGDGQAPAAPASGPVGAEPGGLSGSLRPSG